MVGKLAPPLMQALRRRTESQRRMQDAGKLCIGLCGCDRHPAHYRRRDGASRSAIRFETIDSHRRRCNRHMRPAALPGPDNGVSLST